MNTRQASKLGAYVGLAATLLLTACAGPAVGSDTGRDLCTRAGSLTNPYASVAPGLGGTGAPVPRSADPGGIGGTGQVAQRPGLGGTGAVAMEGGLGGTGIVGVVTGFGSICVNGIKVEYDQRTPLQRDGEQTSLGELAVGQVVALRARGEGEHLRAERIAVLDAAVGPLTQMDAGTGLLVVMGQRATALEPQDLQDLRVGDWVRVSGQRRADGEIRASRVQAATPGEALLTGSLSRSASGWRIADALLSVPSNEPTSRWREGLELRVSGSWDGERLQVREAQLEPTRNALGGVTDVVLQGYVHELRGRELNLGFETLSLSSALRVLGGRLEALRVGQAVRVRGWLDAQQQVVVDRLEFRNEGRRGGGRGRRGGDDRREDGDDRGSDNSSSGSGSSNSGSGSSNSGSGSSNSGSGSSGSSGQGRGRGRGGD
jgi:hypothetical protein